MRLQSNAAARRNKRLAIATIVFLSLPCCCIAKQSQENLVPGVSSKQNFDSLKPIRISASAALEKSGAGGASLFYSKTQLGELQAGREYVVALTLVNNADVPIAIKILKTSCKCVSPRFPESTLQPGDSTTGEIFFRVPAHSATGEFHGRIEFYIDRNGPPIGGLNFSGTILGNLYASASLHLLELKEDIGQWEIPILFTKPISLRTLKTRKSSGLENVVVRLHKAKNGCFLRLSVHSAMLDPNGVLGTVEIYHEPTGQSREISVTISRPQPIRLSPTTLHFSSTKRRPGEYRAIAMLHLTNSKTTSDGVDGDRQRSEPISEVRLMIGDETIPVQMVRLGTSMVYKLTINCSKSFLKKRISEKRKREDREGDSPIHLSWFITTPESTFKVEGDFRVTLKGD